MPLIVIEIDVFARIGSLIRRPTAARRRLNRLDQGVCGNFVHGEGQFSVMSFLRRLTYCKPQQIFLETQTLLARLGSEDRRDRFIELDGNHA